MSCLATQRGPTVEAIRQIEADWGKEERVARYLQSVLPWVLTATPAFYFTDYHINRTQRNRRETYIGDLEIKWLNTPSTQAAIFNYNKLQLMAAVPVYTDHKDSYHRVCFRFTDGLLLVPALALMRLQPVLFTRQDTHETDLVVKVQTSDFASCFRSKHIE